MSRFIFSGGEVVTEVDANNGLKAAIVRGHEILAQKDARDSSYYYLNNAHGDVTALVDGTGAVVNRYQYDAFGNTVEAKEQIPNRFRYAGEQFDAVTGQYYLRARFYNPVVGRFTQEDTYRGDGLNLYSYVQNNPIKYVDPSGYSCESKSNVYAGVGGKNELGTLIDNKVTAIDKTELPKWIQDSYLNSEYATVVTNEEVTLYRVFGGTAEAGGGYASTIPTGSRIQAKIDAALLPEWGGSKMYEATIKVPKGTVLNIGKVAPQITKTGTILSGGVDQILLPQGWSLDWIQEIRVVPSR